MEDPLRDAFGLPPMTREKSDVVVPPPEDDREAARRAIHYALARGIEGAEECADIAWSSQHPRAHEVRIAALSQVTQAAQALARLAGDAPVREREGGPVLQSGEVLALVKKKISGEVP